LFRKTTNAYVTATTI